MARTLASEGRKEVEGELRGGGGGHREGKRRGGGVSTWGASQSAILCVRPGCYEEKDIHETSAGSGFISKHPSCSVGSIFGIH